MPGPGGPGGGPGGGGMHGGGPGGHERMHGGNWGPPPPRRGWGCGPGCGGCLFSFILIIGVAGVIGTGAIYDTLKLATTVITMLA